MAKVGESVEVGTYAPETGQYKHSPNECPNTIILNKGNKVPPCGVCEKPGANWILAKILT
jgi:hypothetical protein